MLHSTGRQVSKKGFSRDLRNKKKVVPKAFEFGGKTKGPGATFSAVKAVTYNNLTYLGQQFLDVVTVFLVYLVSIITDTGYQSEF